MGENSVVFVIWTWLSLPYSAKSCVCRRLAAD